MKQNNKYDEHNKDNNNSTQVIVVERYEERKGQKEKRT